MTFIASDGSLQSVILVQSSTAPDAIGVVPVSDPFHEGQEAPYGEYADGGIPIFLTNEPYLASDGSLQQPIPIILGNAPRPPVPGPLDVISYEADGFTDFSGTFDLASPDVIVGLSCTYTGTPVIALAHGGEPLTIVRQDMADGVVTLLAVGTGLTVEEAEFTITATGGTLDRGGLRVNEMANVAPELAGWAAGETGSINGGISSKLLTVAGAVGGGTVKLAYGQLGKSYTAWATIWSNPAMLARVFWGRTIWGDPLPYSFASDDPAWTFNTNWTINPNGNLELNRTGISGGAFFMSNYAIPEPIHKVAWRVDCYVEDGLSAVKVGGKFAGNGYPGEEVYGPFDGVYYLITYGSEPMVVLQVGMRGKAYIRSIQAMSDGQVFNFAFGSDGAAVDGKIYLGQYGDGTASISGVEVMGADFT